MRRNWLGVLVDIPEFGVVAACVLVFVIVTILQPRFADESNLQVIGLDLSNYGILALLSSETRPAGCGSGPPIGGWMPHPPRPAGRACGSTEKCP